MLCVSGPPNQRQQPNQKQEQRDAALREHGAACTGHATAAGCWRGWRGRGLALYLHEKCGSILTAAPAAPAVIQGQTVSESPRHQTCSSHAITLPQGPARASQNGIFRWPARSSHTAANVPCLVSLGHKLVVVARLARRGAGVAEVAVEDLEPILRATG